LIAEGVETVAQAQRLLALDCPHAQGSLFSDALKSSDIEELMYRMADQSFAIAS
jgi:EAL domain-containing protein (putative c-di-GMP-specific phosphodiesterase class I)